MEITAAAGGTSAVPLPTPAPASTPPAADGASSWSGAVTVTLSPAAQQLLNGAASSTPAATTATPAATTSSTATPAAATWSSDAVTQALAALNDTSGATSVSDQIDAYALMTKLVADPSNFDPSNSANANAVDVATSFATSAYAEHVQSLMAQISVASPNGSEDSEAVQQSLNAFSGLSSDDQQSVVAALNLNSQVEGGQSLYASVGSYVANRQAVIGVDRAAEAALANPAYANAKPPPSNINYDARTDQFRAVSAAASAAGDTATAALVSIAHGVASDSDAFTAMANAYFAQYGPPPAATAAQQAQDAAPPAATAAVLPTADQARSVFTALATLNDTSGRSSIAEQASAYSSFLQSSVGMAGYGVMHTALVTSWEGSSFSQRAQTDLTAYDGTLLPHGTPASTATQFQLDSLNKLSSDDQQIVFQLQGGQSGALGSLGGFKANLQTQVQVDQLYEGLLKTYGVNQYSQIKDTSVTSTDAFKALVRLLNVQNTRTDAWTAQAQAVLSAWGKTGGRTASAA